MPRLPSTHSAATGAASAAGSWKAENVAFAPWKINLTVVGNSVTGTVSQSATDSSDSTKTDLAGPFDIYDGASDGTTLSFKCKSPDGNRTVAFVGNLAGDEIIFTRTVTAREGSSGGQSGIFDSSTPRAFIVKRDLDAPPAPSHAADRPPAESPAPTPPAKPSDKAPDAPADKPSAGKSAGDKPAGDKSSSEKSGVDSSYDPFHAAQDIDVGTFYLHKGDYDAAIERFKDAIRLKPNFAKPRLLLGEIYEKKGDRAQAIRYYKEFLEILPDGPDSKKVRGRLDKLGAK